MLVWVFILGAIVGSFLNVVGLRFRTGLGVQGRSFCPSCGKTLRFWELVPVVSFVLLRGRCSRCRTKISWQYPLVELWTGMLFASLFYKFGLTPHSVLLALVFSIYTVILIYDLRHKIIPDSLVYACIALSLLVPLFFVDYSLFDWLIGPILFSFFGLIWLVSRGRAMGFGDAKLSLSVGFLLGLAPSLSSMAVTFWLATVVTVPMVLFSRKGITMKSEIPLAPFIIIGAWFSLVSGIDIFHVYTLTN